MDEQQRDPQQQQDLTSPPGGKTHEATTPPGKGDLDADALRRAEEQLDLAAGGH